MRACEKCVYGRGDHAKWCGQKIWIGDFLMIEHHGVSTTHTATENVEAIDRIDLQVRIHPPIWYEEDGHRFATLSISMSSAVKARDDFADYMHKRNITPDMLADAMFPGLRGL